MSDDYYDDEINEAVLINDNEINKAASFII